LFLFFLIFRGVVVFLLKPLLAKSFSFLVFLVPPREVFSTLEISSFGGYSAGFSFPLFCLETKKWSKKVQGRMMAPPIRPGPRTIGTLYWRLHSFYYPFFVKAYHRYI
jgi:hypothetical protein